MTDVSHAALAAASLANGTKIQTKAKAFGTFVSPTTGEILYVDPKNDDERHHSPVLTPAEAKEAHMRGFIEDYDTNNDAFRGAVDDGRLPIDANDLRLVGAERTAEFARAEAEGSEGSGTVDSRSSTAWEDRDRVTGGVTGTNETPAETSQSGTPSEIDQESGDADAPPAPATKAKPGRPPKAQQNG